MLLMKIVDAKLGKIKFLSNDILMNIPQLSPMFVPVNKHGGHPREVAKILNEAYDSDIQILIFPAGLASRKIKGKIVDLEWKKHFITKAIRHKSGCYSGFYCRTKLKPILPIGKIQKIFENKMESRNVFASR